MVAFTFVPEKMNTSLYNALRAGYFTRSEGSTVLLNDTIPTVRWDAAVDRGQLYLNVLTTNGLSRIPVYRVSQV